MSNTELPETIWHYTKMDVLGKIILPDGVKIRLTDFRFTNDPSESVVLKEFLMKNKDKILKQLKEKHNIEIVENYFIDAVEDRMESMGEEFDNILKKTSSYIFSMTSLKDSMVFWNKEYAGTNGIAIGFNSNNLKQILQNKEHQELKIEKIDYLDISNIENALIEKIIIDIKATYERTLKICDIEYLKDKKLKKRIVNTFTLLSFLRAYSWRYKYKYWEEEQETRIGVLCSPGETTTEGSKKIQYEFYKDKIIKVHFRKFDKSIVDSIILGPACGREHIEAVEDYLKENGYEGIKVDRSKAFDLRYRG